MMKQIVVEDIKEGPKMVQVPIPKIGPKSVLVKIACSPLTGFDRILGFRGAFPPPYVLGVEASGTIVDIGASVPKEYMGKKVHIATGNIKNTMGSWQGTWSQYIAQDAEDVFIYDQSLSHEVACGIYGNPTMAISLMQAIKDMKASCVIVTPGNTVISRMLTALLKSEGIAVLSIVQSAMDMDLLNEFGQPYVLNADDIMFGETLTNFIKMHPPTILVDSIADETSSFIFKKMPDHSVHLIYGTLSGNKMIPIPVFPLALSQKVVKGFCLSFDDYPDPKGEIRRQLKMVSDDLKKGEKTFAVPVAREYTMYDFKIALDEQGLFGSKGRIIIKFD